jgi:hypothetical protein
MDTIMIQCAKCGCLKEYTLEEHGIQAELSDFVIVKGKILCKNCAN